MALSRETTVKRESLDTVESEFGSVNGEFPSDEMWRELD